jgi:hypothetical protein
MAEPHAQPRPRRVPRWVWFVVVCIALGAMTSVGVAWGIAALSKIPTPIVVPIAAKGITTDPWFPRRWWMLRRAERFGLRVNDIEGERDLVNAPASITHDGVFDRATSDRATRTAVRLHEVLIQDESAQSVGFSVVLYGWPLACLASVDACTHAEAVGAPRARVVAGWSVTTPGFIQRLSRNQTARTVVQFDEQQRELRARPFGPPKDANGLAILSSPWPEESSMHVLTIRKIELPTFPLWPGLLANTAFYGGAWAVLIGVPVLLRRWLRARRGGCPACGYSREG